MDKPLGCPGCGETIIDCLFMRVDCINPRCRHFNKRLLEQHIINAIPIWPLIDQHGWLNPKYLGPYNSKFTEEGDRVFDLWSASDKNDGVFVAQYGSAADQCYWHYESDVRTMDEVRGMFPELGEAMRRFDILEAM